MKNILSLIFLSVMIILFSACESKTQKAKVVESKNTPSTNSKKGVKFTLTTTKGENINLELFDQIIFSKKLNEKVVLVNFWAPWCEPCIKEMPSFVKLQEKYKDKFIILGVLFDKKSTKEEIASFMKKYNVNFPITVGEENFKLAKAFNDVKMIPESFLFTKDGIFIKKFVGEISEDTLEQYIKEHIE